VSTYKVLVRSVQIPDKIPYVENQRLNLLSEHVHPHARKRWETEQRICLLLDDWSETPFYRKETNALLLTEAGIHEERLRMKCMKKTEHFDET
jgi:hypothetical protein